MQIKFWGVRGSFPHTLSTLEWVNHYEAMMRRFFELGFKGPQDINTFLSQHKSSDIGGFGSATTCIEVKDSQASLIIDGGSGLKKLSDGLEQHRQIVSGQEHHILLTHFHFDHIMGIPFFMPHFRSDQKIHYYCVQNECEQIVRSLFQKPMFPVPFSQLASPITFHKLVPYEKTIINGFEVIPYQTDHPDACYGFKISKNGKAYSHAVDNEADRITANDLQKDAGLYQNTNLLYMDAQYIENEMTQKKGWGHGTFERAFKLCQNFEIQKVVLGHHDPSLDNVGIEKLIKAAGQFVEQKPELRKIQWSFVYEGQTVEV